MRVAADLPQRRRVNEVEVTRYQLRERRLGIFLGVAAEQLGVIGHGGSFYNPAAGQRKSGPASLTGRRAVETRGPRAPLSLTLPRRVGTVSQSPDPGRAFRPGKHGAPFLTALVVLS